ncbi:hypothetical protein VNO77_34420 [Canavalia gladiata]|uniref:HECT-type E3 ubiquitin transferase n=1 Tax=Canavalia gladiata TaxID=3824 RepID=A0AAN9KF31_CANGL
MNICRELHPKNLLSFMEVVPILCNLVRHKDQQIVENVATCLIKIVRRVDRYSEMLDELYNRPKLLQKVRKDVLPQLIQMFNADASLHVCHGSLSVVYKLVYSIESDMLEELLRNASIANDFLKSFIKEGIFIAMEALSSPETFLHFHSPALGGIHQPFDSSHRSLSNALNDLLSMSMDNNTLSLDEEKINSILHQFLKILNGVPMAKGTLGRKHLAKTDPAIKNVHMVEVVGSGSRVPPMSQYRQIFLKESKREMNANVVVVTLNANLCDVTSQTVPFGVGSNGEPDWDFCISYGSFENICSENIAGPIEGLNSDLENKHAPFEKPHVSALSMENVQNTVMVLLCYC